MIKKSPNIAAAIAALTLSVAAFAHTKGDVVASANSATEQDLYKEFLNPPKSARPRVWWHWMNGNITKDGIRKDLLWMQKTGIVGFHNFDAGLETPQIVDKRLIYMTPEWKDAFKYAINLADSLDMEMTIASSPGWSETGGPWVKDEDAMKKLVWRQIEVEGGKPLCIKLPEGFAVTGPFQDFCESFDGISQVFLKKKFYKDIAVVGVKLCDADINLKNLKPTITTSGSKVSGEEILDHITGDSVGDYLGITADKDGKCWIQYEFTDPHQVRCSLGTQERRGTIFTHQGAALQQRRCPLQGHSAFLSGRGAKDLRHSGHHCQVLQIQPQRQWRQERLPFRNIPVRPLDCHQNPTRRRQGRQQFLPSSLDGGHTSQHRSGEIG